MLQPAMESKLMLSHPAKESKLILSPVANPTMLLQPAKESKLMLSPVTNPVIAPESTPINPTIKPPINILENAYQECITTVLAPESKVRSKSYTRFWNDKCL